MYGTISMYTLERGRIDHNVFVDGIAPSNASGMDAVAIFARDEVEASLDTAGARREREACVYERRLARSKLPFLTD